MMWKTTQVSGTARLREDEGRAFSEGKEYIEYLLSVCSARHTRFLLRAM